MMKRKVTPRCPKERTMARIWEKKSGMVMFQLSSKVVRFRQLLMMKSNAQWANVSERHLLRLMLSSSQYKRLIFDLEERWIISMCQVIYKFRCLWVKMGGTWIRNFQRKKPQAENAYSLPRHAGNKTDITHISLRLWETERTNEGLFNELGKFTLHSIWLILVQRTKTL